MVYMWLSEVPTIRVCVLNVHVGMVPTCPLVLNMEKTAVLSLALNLRILYTSIVIYRKL